MRSSSTSTPSNPIPSHDHVPGDYASGIFYWFAVITFKIKTLALLYNLKDKYDLQEQLIARKSYKLFHDAIKKLNKKKFDSFYDQIIFVIDYVIDELTKNKLLLKFISKNLSFGLYSEKINKLIGENSIGVKEIFLKGMEENNIKLENPEVTLFMIIELTSSTCFSCIMKHEPLSIKEYKPYLYDAIKKILMQ